MGITTPRQLGTALLLLASASLLACAAPAASPAPKPAAPAAPAASAPAPARTEAPAARAEPAPPRTVKLGVSMNVTAAPLLLAIERGYFRDAGIEIDIVPMGGGAEMAAPLSTGELDVGMGGISASLFNALARGVDLKIVGDFSRMSPGHGFGGFLVRKDLDLPTLAALRGQRVGFNNPGAPCHYMVGRMLESAGLTVADVEVLNMPFNTIPGAMSKREVDGVCAAEPWLTNTLRAGDSRLVMTYDDLLPNLQVSVVMVSNQFAADRPALERFLAAFLRAVPESREKSPEVLDLVSRATGLDVAVLRETYWTDLDSDGRVNVDSIKDQQSFFMRAGLVQTPIDVDRYVDLSYLPRR